MPRHKYETVWTRAGETKYRDKQNKTYGMIIDGVNYFCRY